MENLKYQSNRLSELKREALLELDVEILQNVQRYESITSARLYYYVRVNEQIIYDRQGKVIDRKTLPFDQDETSLHFRTLVMGFIVSQMPDKPGDLNAEISFVNRQTREWTVEILEVPQDTQFPLPNDFKWFEVCNAFDFDYYKNDVERLNIYSWHTKATT